MNYLDVIEPIFKLGLQVGYITKDSAMRLIEKFDESYYEIESYISYIESLNGSEDACDGILNKLRYDKVNCAIKAYILDREVNSNLEDYLQIYTKAKEEDSAISLYCIPELWSVAQLDYTYIEFDSRYSYLQDVDQNLTSDILLSYLNGEDTTFRSILTGRDIEGLIQKLEGLYPKWILKGYSKYTDLGKYKSIVKKDKYSYFALLLLLENLAYHARIINIITNKLNMNYLYGLEKVLVQCNIEYSNESELLKVFNENDLPVKNIKMAEGSSCYINKF